MIRTAALAALALSFVGCSQFQPARGPFAKPKKDPPPPYGSPVSTTVPNAPVANQSQLGIATADPAPPRAGDDPPLIPAKDMRTVSAIVPAAPVAPVNRNLADLKELVATARASWKALDGYEGTMTRRELNPKGVLNSEVLLYQFRREPMSVYSRTTAGNGKGREVLYAPTKHGDKMHVVLGDGDSMVAKAGFKPDPVSPDNDKVRAKARYSIRDAGFGKWIERLGAAVAQLERGVLAPGALTFDGPVSRPEFVHPLTSVTHRLKPGEDPAMPDGGTRVYLFDTAPSSPSCGMPLVIAATDPTGREAEFYLFEKFRAAAFTDADFNPARLGKK
jgi:hypothetical protein